MVADCNCVASMTRYCCMMWVLLLASSAAIENPTRVASTFEWCDCGKGLHNVTVWPGSDKSKQRTVSPSSTNEPVWIDFGSPVATMGWRCDSMDTDQSTTFHAPVAYWSLHQSTQPKGSLCGKESGRLKVLGWQSASFQTSVVYSSGEHGYACIKIPVLLHTAAGTLLAFAEARKDSCSDFAWTDLVVKRSSDGGRSWSPLRVVRTASGPGLPATVIGNAAPVQLMGGAHGDRILVPHTRNNSDVWLTFSDDDGLSFSTARQLANVTVPGWNWVGTGPPGSLQLRSGRVLVPTYHGQNRGNVANNKVHGNVMLSDDAGATWRLGSPHGFGAADKFSNENQAVQLSNNSVLINARSLANPGHNHHRIQTVSDDGGETFGPTRYVPELPQPIDGCEGSIVTLAPRGLSSGTTAPLVFSGPKSEVLRTKMTLWVSHDEGASWQEQEELDTGMSGYSSLQPDCATVAAGKQTCAALLLYEQSDTAQVVMNPDRFVFRRIPVPSR